MSYLEPIVAESQPFYQVVGEREDFRVCFRFAGAYELVVGLPELSEASVLRLIVAVEASGTKQFHRFGFISHFGSY